MNKTLLKWKKQAQQLSETIETDLTPSTSNGVDVHFMRATEYGAIAILSASAYGNPSNEQAITTTTGNNTGIILDTTKWELTAGRGGNIAGANARYYDLYTSSNSSAKPGDALGDETTANPGCAGWHLASSSTWIGTINGFVRGKDGIFSFANTTNNGNNYARAVAVCGTGL